MKDKRGRTGSATASGLTVLDYSPPVIVMLNVGRCDADGTDNDKGEYVKVRISGRVTSLNSKNKAVYVLKYKKTSESTFTSVTLSEYENQYAVTDATYIFAADTGSSYDVSIEITDDFDTVKSSTTASTAFTLMHWLSNGLGMAFGKIAELTGVLDIGFQTKFSGGILQPVLQNETDLNTVLIPNKYSGIAATTAGYLNCPITSATSFVLEVMSGGDAGQLIQRITTCTKSKPVVYERSRYSDAWGDWIRVSDFGNKILWSGGYYMTASHTAQLSEPISKQPTGIVLVFSRYSDGTVRDYHFQTAFIPKSQVEKHPGTGHVFMLTSDGEFGLFAAKYEGGG